MTMGEVPNDRCVKAPIMPLPPVVLLLMLCDLLLLLLNGGFLGMCYPSCVFQSGAGGLCLLPLLGLLVLQL